MFDFAKAVFMLAEMVVASWLVGWAIIAIIDRLEGVRRNHQK